VPTLVQVPELPQAFQTGRVDGMVTSAATGVNIKSWDFVTYYHDTQAWLPKNVIAVNSRSLRGLDAATRDALMASAKTAETRGWKMSMEVTSTTTDDLSKNGMKVITPSAELKDGIKKIGDTMAAEWAKSAGAEGAAILEAYRK
jgi:TRAP-type C4-dicarboxylate transport system substrate-binding protein